MIRPEERENFALWLLHRVPLSVACVLLAWHCIYAFLEGGWTYFLIPFPIVIGVLIIEYIGLRIEMKRRANSNANDP